MTRYTFDLLDGDDATDLSGIADGNHRMALNVATTLLPQVVQGITASDLTKQVRVVVRDVGGNPLFQVKISIEVDRAV
ncbi:DUF6894 family protein [Lichenihabitans psoromatis]|uniref:DUF6894 family protein n=1 Tax=Lichenihabitans psoromatis TaxID=2528642 RepID=UPI001036B7F1|nr:hypothetical protein [Lichenihabitans psoromatis]